MLKEVQFEDLREGNEVYITNKESGVKSKYKVLDNYNSVRLLFHAPHAIGPENITCVIPKYTKYEYIFEKEVKTQHLEVTVFDLKVGDVIKPRETCYADLEVLSFDFPYVQLKNVECGNCLKRKLDELDSYLSSGLVKALLVERQV